jgi:fructosamine-3-kinase
VHGGCINPSVRLEAEDGDAFFLKWNPSAPVQMFAAEADGLRALMDSRSLRIPEVLGWGGSGTESDPGWLLLEYIPPRAAPADFGQRLGEGLGRLHNSLLEGPAAATLAVKDSPSGSGTPQAPGPFGWRRDNFIGSLPQENGFMAHWPSYWRERRLEPQIRLARDAGFFRDSSGEVLDDLLDRLEPIMAGTEDDGPALLHGDLWTGNYYAGPQGEPVLIDPAVYIGAGEVDLAMMELFGSLPAGFVEAYQNVRGWAAEYGAFRRDLYQLYYLLVHVNLFGGGYLGGSLAAARRALAGG